MQIKESTKIRLEIAKKHMGTLVDRVFLVEPEYMIIDKALEKYYAYIESVKTGKRVQVEIEEELNEIESKDEIKVLGQV